jgi:hypothetical protein
MENALRLTWKPQPATDTGGPGSYGYAGPVRLFHVWRLRTGTDRDWRISTELPDAGAPGLHPYISEEAAQIACEARLAMWLAITGLAASPVPVRTIEDISDLIRQHADQPRDPR